MAEALMTCEVCMEEAIRAGNDPTHAKGKSPGTRGAAPGISKEAGPVQPTWGPEERPGRGRRAAQPAS